MPREIELRVEAKNTGLATHLLVGDKVTLPRGITGLIESMEAKQTYLYVNLVGGSRGRFPIGSEVNVTRMVPTAEEQINDRMKLITDEVEKSWDRARREMGAAMDRLTTTYQDRRSKGVLVVFDLDLAFEVKVKELEWRMWEEVRSDMLDLIGRASTVPGSEAVRAVARQRHICREHLESTANNRALSRSTSYASNIEEDMLREAMAKFLYATKYDKVEELLEMVGGHI